MFQTKFKAEVPDPSSPKNIALNSKYPAITYSNTIVEENAGYSESVV
jgi:hypothetical protein